MLFKENFKTYFMQKVIIKRFITILGIFITFLSVYLYIYNIYNNINETTIYTAEIFATKIQHVLERYRLKTDSIKIIIQILNGELTEKNFNLVASKLYTENEIQAIQYLKNGVVEYVYPKEGNEITYGYNILTNPKRKKVALLNIQSNNSVVGGPYDLLQGNKGLIITNPVFIGEKENKFIGFVSLVLDLEQFLNFCGLNQLVNLGYDYSIFDASEESEYNIISQSREKFYKNSASYPIKYGIQDLWIIIQPKFNYLQYISCIFIVIGGILTTLYFRKLSSLMIERYEIILYEAQHDNLTGLYNRKMIRDYIENELKRNKNLYGSTVLIDLDNFKRINDEEGHNKGDEVLITLTKIINEIFRKDDIKVRLGGDEFMIYMPNLTVIEDLEKIIDKFIICVREELKQYYKKHNLSVSIGVAISNYEINSYKEMYELADRAMYVIKEKGKDGYYINK